MYEVNRSVAIIRPKAPFLQWLKTIPGELDPALTLEALGRDCNAMLIPAEDDPAELQKFVLQHYRQLFEAELADWCDEPSYWPEQITPEHFQAWFDVQIHSVLTDLVDDPLEREAFVPFDMDLD
jgi:hypothetical protein